MKKENLIPEIGLNEADRTALIGMLNTLVADENVLYAQTRSAHWNISGPQFFALHELLEEQYNQLQADADQIAERVRMLGGVASGTMAAFVEKARLDEKPVGERNWEEMINALRQNHEKLAALLRNDIEQAADDHHDEGTADLFVALLRMHEEMAWMLRATLTS